MHFVTYPSHSVLVGVADSACARKVAGTQWAQAYTDKLMEQGQRPVLQQQYEAYRFGTDKIHYSSYVVVCCEFGDYEVQVRASITTGDMPLLLSCTVLDKLGMIYMRWRAGPLTLPSSDFAVSRCCVHLPVTIPVVSAKSDSTAPLLQAEDLRLQPREQYMSDFTVTYRTPTARHLP